MARQDEGREMQRKDEKRVENGKIEGSFHT
jgi:hypothetical protein